MTLDEYRNILIFQREIVKNLYNEGLITEASLNEVLNAVELLDDVAHLTPGFFSIQVQVQK